MGYAHLQKFCEGVLPSKSVATKEKYRGAGRSSIPNGATIVVPFDSIETDASMLDHLLLAIKYEGIELPIIGEVLKQIPAQAIADAFSRTPTSEYIRRIAYLWEHFNNHILEGLVIPARRPVKLFNPDEYYVRKKGKIDPRWNVEFNGLGDLNYCPVVRRNKRLELADERLWSGYEDFIKKGNGQEIKTNPDRLFQPKLNNSLLARTMRHAFLDETESSFRIESEEPSGNRKEQFVQLLRNAHESRKINEEFLSELQRFCVDPRWHEFEYRNNQNWLGNGARTLSSRVTYVPPPPEIVPEMMKTLCELVNSPHENDLPAIARAGVISFGFVYIHPFLDGNGRISRYLAHQSLCNSGKLPHGMVLPLSSVMLDEQESYHAALIEFSEPMRKMWDVSPSSNPDIPNFVFNGNESAYRYWSGDSSAAFVTDMGRIALNQKLIQEAMFLEAYDECIHKIGEHAAGLPDKEVSLLVRMAVANIQAPGSLSKNHRKKFSWLGTEKIGNIESIIQDSFLNYFEASGKTDIHEEIQKEHD